MVTVIDCGMGNVGSISNMLRRLGVACTVSHLESDLLRASRLILPGVGAFDHGVRKLRESGLIPALEEAVHRRGIPLLGICLGMQLLGKRSEEGCEPGLGWLDADCVRFRVEDCPTPIKVPHMGWNTVAPVRPGADWLDSNARYYFVHGYHLQCRDEDDIIGRTTYGYPFASAVKRGNVVGVQFHPEKSHRFGLEVLRTFAEWRC